MTLIGFYFFITLLLYVISRNLGDMTDRLVENPKSKALLYLVCISLNLFGTVTGIVTIYLLINSQ